MFALRDVGNGQFIDADFGVDEDDESFEEELSTDHVSIYELAPSYDHEAFESHDEDLEQTVWSSFLLGSDYDWDDGLEVDIREWLYERYGDVIAWNDEFGFRPSPHPSFHGRNRLNVGALSETEVIYREDRPYYRTQRGYGPQRAPKWQRGWTGRTRRLYRHRY